MSETIGERCESLAESFLDIVEDGLFSRGELVKLLAWNYTVLSLAGSGEDHKLGLAEYIQSQEEFIASLSSEEDRRRSARDERSGGGECA